MWLVKTNIKYNSNAKLNWLIRLYTILSYKKNYSNKKYVLNFTYNNFKAFTLIKAPCTISSNLSCIENSKLLSTFKTFINIGATTTSGLVGIHHSNRQLFFKPGSPNNTFTSIRLLYQIYKNYISLIFNILFYDIKLLLFGNSVFRQDIQALNWSSLSLYSSFFKLNNISMFFQPNKLNDKFPKIFKLLRISGFYTAMVYDVNYHKRTIYYLQRLSFFSIGVTPANLPRYTLNIALPSLNDNLLMHLFSMKLYVFIKQKVNNKLFNNFYNLWSS